MEVEWFQAESGGGDGGGRGGGGGMGQVHKAREENFVGESGSLKGFSFFLFFLFSLNRW